MPREETLIVGFNKNGKVIYRHELMIKDLNRKAARLKILIKFLKKDVRVVKITLNGIEAWNRP